MGMWTTLRVAPTCPHSHSLDYDISPLHRQPEGFPNCKYGTENIDEAAQLYFQQSICPLLQRYDPKEYYPYPELVKRQMRLNSIYRIVRSDDGRFERRFLGVHPLVYET